ncbi:CHRD domain-containing protein [Daejeonella rubra]|uniref:CHRD domain-containing protein n=1 Tax=Daejeonella rubra TaxID=990371 RepID=A0A1G9QJZ0_9SPHI|nr:CHRD domain-containing protein [Daejeonella rubra]SDM11220.1 CHRD domain-containing protein [Daejeonella rubra]
MKKSLLIGSIKSISLIMLAVIILSGCKKDEVEEPVSLIKKATITLSGAQEVPAVTTSGTGTAEISYDPTMKMITYKITWQLGNPSATTTNMHFHGSETGSDLVSSGVAIGITGFATGSAGLLNGMTIALTDVQAAQLLAGKWYVNIHSSTVGSGELRGNIKFN